ncbi:MAG: dTDP-4-dehydrorhamnose reductase [Bacteroidota bacterium]
MPDPPRRLLILGARGQVGLELTHSLASLGQVIGLDRADCDLTDLTRLPEIIRQHRPDVIVNAAAYTAVDRAESEPKLAHRINAEAPGVLAEVARQLDALLVHYSTDYVFDGTATRLIPETEPTNPLGVYGRTKLAGEEAIREVGGAALIVRTSWVYAAHGRNFLRTMLRLGDEREVLRVVDDQVGSPTSAPWLARATADLIGTALQNELATPDLVHATCQGETTWYGFARAIFDHWPPAALRELVPISTEAYPTPARRPAYSVLDTTKLQEVYGVTPPHWTDALDALDLHQPGGGQD